MTDDTCRPVEVDGETIPVLGARELTEAERGHLAEVVRAAKAKRKAEIAADPHAEIARLERQLEMRARLFTKRLEWAQDKTDRLAETIARVRAITPYCDISSAAGLVRVVRLSDITAALGPTLDELSAELDAEFDDPQLPHPAHDGTDDIDQLIERLGQVMSELTQAQAERDRYAAALARVRELHQPETRPGWSDTGCCKYCYAGGSEPYVPWPCPTIAALNGTEDGPR